MNVRAWKVDGVQRTFCEIGISAAPSKLVSTLLNATSAANIRVFRIVFMLVLSAFAVPSLKAQTTTVTLDFDEPEFQNGSSIQTVGDITFFHGAKVFQPTHVMTFSGNQSLRPPANCADSACTNGSFRMDIRFGTPLPNTNNGWLWRRAQSVSMRIGADTVATGCFPEGTDCSMYAYLVGLDDHAAIVARSDDVLLYSAAFATGFMTNIDKEISLDDPAARIVRVVLVYGKDTFSHDPAIPYPGEPQIDHLVVIFPDNPPAQTQVPAAPTVQISAPADGASLFQPYQVQLQGSVNLSGKPSGFCFELNQPVPTLAVDCREGQRLSANNTFDIFIDDAQLKPGMNTLSATVFDLWGQRGTQSVSFNTRPPYPPRVSIWQPTDFEWLSAGNASYISGSVYTVGALAGFCVVVNAGSVPTEPNCQQNLASAVYYGFEPLSFGLQIAQGQFRSGANKISVFSYDRWGQMGSAEVSVNLPTDFRVVAMEISQGIQKPELPLNILGSAQYLGVRLRSRVPTVVRVFANSPNVGTYCCATMQLSGFVPDPQLGEKALGTILPDFTPTALFNGNIDVPLAVRADSASAYIFTLPTGWTLQNGLRLKAVLQPQLPLQECPTCGGNNSFSVFGINFEQPVSITINPIELTFTNSTGAMVRAPSPVLVFGPVRNISPVPPASATVLPYAGTIDVSDLVNTAGGCRNVNTTCEDAVFGRVAAFDTSGTPGFKIGVGPIDVGLEKPVVYYRFPQIISEAMAVADTRSLLTAAGHEFYHELGYYHASPGCPPVDFFNLWPPDQLGYIHGFGLDRRKLRDSNGFWNGQYKIFAPSTLDAGGNTIQYYDLMSYCASENTAWISVENWNSFGGAFPNGLIPDSIFLGNSTATISQGEHGKPGNAKKVEGGSLRLSAIVNQKGGLSTFRVDRAEGWILVDPPKSKYVFTVRDARRNVLARVPALVIPPRGHTSAGTTLTAHVPAKDAESIEVEHDGRIIGEMKRSPSAPVLKVGSPEAGTSVSGDGSLKVAWGAKDADGDSLEVKIAYSSGPDKPFRVLFIGPNRGEWTVPGFLFGASTNGALRITANDGFNETTETVEHIKVSAAGILLEIIAPQTGTSFPHASPIRLEAAAFRDQFTPLTAEHLIWSVDGVKVGIGSEVEVRNLQSGKHTAKVTANDGDSTASREIVFIVRTRPAQSNPSGAANKSSR